jgi:glycerol uptake facilitator-like aquaporin
MVGGVSRYILADTGRLRQRGAGGGISARIGLLGVSLAFGLTVVTGAYAFGPVSGGHFNPAVSVGLVIGKRFSASELPGYIISQVLGAIAAAGVLYLIVSARLASAAWADSPRTATVPIAGRLQPAVGAGAKS